MKTREQIYSGEAASLLRDITTYHCVGAKQIARLYRGKENKVENLLRHLVKQGRIFYDAENDVYCDNREMQVDTEMLTALWVLADFGDKLEYHSADTFPTKIVFFADGEVYEIICLSADKEAVILYSLSTRKEGQNGKLILIVDDADAIENITLEDAVFCTVNPNDGTVQYYKKE